DASDDPRLIAYIVPEANRAGPVLQLARLEQDGEWPRTRRYDLPNGMPVSHQNPGETDFLYQEIFEQRCYLRHGITLPDAACVFDVGAHIGLFTLFVRQESPRATVHAF